jgi:hypothetical protein
MRPLCSTLAILGVVTAGPLASQAPLVAPAEGRGTPGGAVTATLHAGAKVLVNGQRGGEVLVALEGWVPAAMLGAKRDTFAASVGGSSPLKVRETPSLQAAVLAELKPGTGVIPIARQGAWTRVRRSVWIEQKALPKSAVPAPGMKGADAAPSNVKPPAPGMKGADAAPSSVKPPAPGKKGADAASSKLKPPATVEDPVLPAPTGSMSATRATKLLSAPGGAVLGDLTAGSVVQPLVRDRGWVRVRVEGWVNERDLAPADSSFAANLSAADLRADPAGTHGKVVRWEVQILSLQAADPLRRDMAREEPYLLARGPAGEDVLLYLTIPPSLLSEAKAIPPLTHVIITARVRSGHSEPVGTPILDLKTIARR